MRRSGFSSLEVETSTAVTRSSTTRVVPRCVSATRILMQQLVSHRHHTDPFVAKNRTRSGKIEENAIRVCEAIRLK